MAALDSDMFGGRAILGEDYDCLDDRISSSLRKIKRIYSLPGKGSIAFFVRQSTSTNPDQPLNSKPYA